jgi:hypothetical protein
MVASTAGASALDAGLEPVRDAGFFDAGFANDAGLVDAARDGGLEPEATLDAGLAVEAGFAALDAGLLTGAALEAGFAGLDAGFA